uniref:EF-hand domain-containing protein n=1 Tax=Meloidogyne hapla TaxID=6305 RepID=A0A1I8BDR9_MELHA
MSTSYEFKKIGRVGTLPAMAHSSAPHAGLQMAISGNEQYTTTTTALSSSRAAFHQRWGVGSSANRRGSHLIGGWDSARPHSAARQQQQMLERLYTKGELKEYQQLFKMFDTDGSGAIGSGELKEAMLRIGLDADDAEIERLIKEVDEDGNGEIDFPEFCQCMKTAERQGGFRQRPTNDEVVRQCFEYVAKEIGGFSHELAEFVFRELLGDSSADQLDMDRFSAIVEDYLLSDNNKNNEEEEENLEDNNDLINKRNNDKKLIKNLINTKLF